MRKHFRFIAGLCGLACLLIAGSAGAATPAAVTQSYNAGAAVLPGMVVEAAPKDAATVIPLTAKDIHNMLGAVVPAIGAAIVLTPQTTSAQQVLVSASGRYSLLVSNQNGPIKSGDYVSVSALPGIVMKAGSDQTEAVGRAAGDFNGSGSLGSMSLKGDAGHSTTVAIGHIPVNVQLSANPLFQKNTNGLSGFVTSAANSLSGRPVSASRAYISAAIALTSLVITGIMFYA
ncbi:MAG TPA: hypothetical protein VIJ68_00840, partial [Candidatus Saccharimonadales bacterium]